LKYARYPAAPLDDDKTALSYLGVINIAAIGFG
jgi:hypothetical protein